MIATPSINALSSTAYVSIPTRASFLGFAASLAAWFLLIPHFGVVGVALGFVVGAVLTGGIPAYYAVRLLGTSPIAFVRAGALLAGLAGTMMLVRSQPVTTSMLFAGVVGLLSLPWGRFPGTTRD
jgi:O-antigen/teichoic acid export membrane protein